MLFSPAVEIFLRQLPSFATRSEASNTRGPLNLYYTETWLPTAFVPAQSRMSSHAYIRYHTVPSFLFFESLLIDMFFFMVMSFASLYILELGLWLSQRERQKSSFTKLSRFSMLSSLMESRSLDDCMLVGLWHNRSNDKVLHYIAIMAIYCNYLINLFNYYHL